MLLSVCGQVCYYNSRMEKCFPILILSILVGDFGTKTDTLRECLSRFLLPTTTSSGLIGEVPSIEIRSCVSYK